MSFWNIQQTMTISKVEVGENFVIRLDLSGGTENIIYILILEMGILWKKIIIQVVFLQLHTIIKVLEQKIKNTLVGGF